MPTATLTRKQTIEHTWITVGEPTDDGLRAVGITTLKGNNPENCVCDTYFVRMGLSQLGGLAFHFEKFGEPNSQYDVLLNAPGGGHTCECWGSLRWTPKTGKPCRHMRMAQEIVKTLQPSKPQATI
jgi:hypothetical protein